MMLATPTVFSRRLLVRLDQIGGHIEQNPEAYIIQFVKSDPATEVTMVVVCRTLICFT